MTDRIFTALLIALFAFAAVTLWAAFQMAKPASVAEESSAAVSAPNYAARLMDADLLGHYQDARALEYGPHKLLIHKHQTETVEEVPLG